MNTVRKRNASRPGRGNGKKSVLRLKAYRQDQKTAQEDWLANNPGYFKKYRQEHPEYTAGNRVKQHIRNQKRKTTSDPIAKMDAITFENKVITGRYELVPVMPGMIAKMDVWTFHNCLGYGPA